MPFIEAIVDAPSLVSAAALVVLLPWPVRARRRRHCSRSRSPASGGACVRGRVGGNAGRAGEGPDVPGSCRKGRACCSIQVASRKRFWMRNTYVSLDMIFIRADGRILRIAENTVPLSEALVPVGRAGARRAGGGRPAPPGSSGSRPATGWRIRSSMHVDSRIDVPTALLASWRGLLLKTERCIESAHRRRGIAQPGSAGVLGTPGRRFKSCCPDQISLCLSIPWQIRSNDPFRRRSFRSSRATLRAPRRRGDAFFRSARM